MSVHAARVWFAIAYCITLCQFDKHGSRLARGSRLSSFPMFPHVSSGFLRFPQVYSSPNPRHPVKTTHHAYSALL